MRLNLGYHHYYDKNAHWYNNAQDKLDHGTNEYLAGVEWDVTPRVNISCGGQITRYGLTDAYMNDLSFVVNSYSAGFGVSYKATDHLTLTAAYFQTNYTDYDKRDVNRAESQRLLHTYQPCCRPGYAGRFLSRRYLNSKRLVKPVMANTLLRPSLSPEITTRMPLGLEAFSKARNRRSPDEEMYSN